MAGKDVVVKTEDFPTHGEFLAAIEREFGVQVVDSAEYGGGQLVEKESLVGVPFVVLDWNTRKSSKFTRAENSVITPTEFVVVSIVDANSERKIFTDGGTGILPVLQAHFDRTQSRGGIYCKEGLRRSEYTYTDEHTGQSSAARTYYLA